MPTSSIDARRKEPPTAGAGQTRAASRDRQARRRMSGSCAAKVRECGAQSAEFVPACALLDTGAGGDRLRCLREGVTHRRDRYREPVSAILRAAEDHCHDSTL